MDPVQVLLGLPWLLLSLTTANNTDWLDSIGYVTDLVSNTPVPLDDIELSLTVRTSADDLGNLFFASTSNGLIQILPATAGSTVNSVWMLAVYADDFPGFLKPGTYVIEMQGIVGGYKETIVSGTLVVTQGVSK